MRIVSETASLQRNIGFISVCKKKKTQKHQNVYEYSYLCLNWFVTEVKSMWCIRGYLMVKTMLGLSFTRVVSLIRSEALHTFFRHERSGRRLVTAASSAQITRVSY